MSKSSEKPLVLVTGASGFIAGQCVRELLEHGYRVRGTVRSLADEKKIGHLRELGRVHNCEIELVEADLSHDAGWSQAVAGATFILHVASPFPASTPDDENELIRPAVDGALRVLSAAAATDGTVRRVVMTSSVAAAAFGHPDQPGKVFTEEDWSNLPACQPYQKSKTLAEQGAWEFVAGLAEGQRFELAVINPGFVVGPVLGRDCGTSAEVLRKLMSRELPACPRIGWAVVDVRDVALAHRLAMENPSAAGNRYIVAGDHVWMQDAAKMMAEEFKSLGYRIPTGALPYWLMWIGARFDKTVRMALGYVGHREDVSADKARRELGWQPRPARESFIDMGHSLIDRDIVSAP